MAQIIPFRGIRYSPEFVADISDVVAPPYDRVYPDVQDACYDRHPNNIVRIIKGRAEPTDNDGNNVYTRAATYLRTWLERGVLIRDKVPTIYAYNQTYSFSGKTFTRKGVIALGRLEPDRVHAHEKTLRGPKEDRLRLMRATEANFGHIFMLYSDPERIADIAVTQAIHGCPPLMEAHDADGNLHQVWGITSPEVIGTVQEAMSARELYIADGHHRYETAVTYMDECTQRGWKPAAPESFDVRMMTLFNIDEPGMTIRPIHRLVHALPPERVLSFFERASEHFTLVEVADRDAALAALAANRSKHAFACFAGGRWAVLVLPDGTDIEAIVSGAASAEYKSLDVSILHAAVLDNLLGIDAAALEEQTHLTYTVDSADGEAQVRGGSEQLLILLNPTTPGQVRRIADFGEKMPQKSTDFYPKLLTGLVLSKMEIDR
ncbi:DUF1015 domain-containing protein [Candidatus Bipolaricaulota bacterium]|nr:DUF1015 domain-containing protein [Candidatus Bipolaricaulota bacterium]